MITYLNHRRLRGVTVAATVCALVGLGGPATASQGADGVRVLQDVAYGPAEPGNLLDLYLPVKRGASDLPLVIWHSGSAFLSSTTKDDDQSVAIAEEFTARGCQWPLVSARRWPVFWPAGGQENCPVVASWFARGGGVGAGHRGWG